jgi:hypothetical protein
MNMRMLNGWVQTHQLAGKVIPESIQGGVASLQELEVDFSVRLLTDELHLNVCHGRLTNPVGRQQGTQNGIHLREVAREIEEFSGLVAIMDSDSHSLLHLDTSLAFWCVCCLDKSFSKRCRDGRGRNARSLHQCITMVV